MYSGERGMNLSLRTGSCWSRRARSGSTQRGETVQENKETRREDMINEYSRTELLIGGEGIRRLRESTVLVFGVGGVGSTA